jgi:hypothetical protein
VVVQEQLWSCGKRKIKEKDTIVKSRLAKISKNPENECRPRQRRQKLVRAKA